MPHTLYSSLLIAARCSFKSSILWIRRLMAAPWGFGCVARTLLAVVCASVHGWLCVGVDAVVGVRVCSCALWPSRRAWAFAFAWSSVRRVAGCVHLNASPWGLHSRFERHPTLGMLSEPFNDWYPTLGMFSRLALVWHTEHVGSSACRLQSYM